MRRMTGRSYAGISPVVIGDSSNDAINNTFNSSVVEISTIWTELCATRVSFNKYFKMINP